MSDSGSIAPSARIHKGNRIGLQYGNEPVPAQATNAPTHMRTHTSPHHPEAQNGDPGALAYAP